ncbi:MAG: metalloprotease PmbA [Pseudomonadota bacterium]
MSPTSLSPDYATDVAHSVVQIARQKGLEAAVSVNAGEGLSVTVRAGEVETLEYHQDKAVHVTVYDGQRKGSATSKDFSPQSLAETVAAAADIARNAEPDKWSGLLEPRYLAQTIPDLDLDHPWEISAEDAIALALRAAEAAQAAEREVSQVDEAGVSHYRGVHAYANSHGFAGAYAGTRHGLNCIVVGARDGAMQRGYWFSSARRASALESPETVGRLAAARAVAKLGARKLTTRRAPVIFEARLATGLVGSLVAASSGGNLYREASFLRDAAGTQVMPAFLTIEEDPFLPQGLGSAPFDAEGGATHRRRVIDAGVLTGYFLDGYSARRLGLTPTGNAGGPHNLLVGNQGEDLQALLRRMGRGLLVTDLMGHGTNLLTGDYSRGASGFWVEGGTLAYPVEEITIAGNLREMLRGIVAVGSDEETRGSTRIGSVLLEEMTIAGE